MREGQGSALWEVEAVLCATRKETTVPFCRTGKLEHRVRRRGRRGTGHSKHREEVLGATS